MTCLDPLLFDITVACPAGSTLWDGLQGRDGIRLVPLDLRRRPGPGDAAALARLTRLVRRADIVHAHSSKAGFLARLAAVVDFRRRRCVFTPHGWSFWSASDTEARVYLELERLAARWCKVIIAVSEHERDAGLAARIGGIAKYRIIHNGVDLERFSLAPSPVTGRVVGVLRLAAPKRADLLVRAFAQVSLEHPGSELHLIGDGPERMRMEALISQLGIEDSVRLLGERDDVPLLLSQAACLVHSSDYEGCPISLLEAMAAGVPVVAGRVGGVPEIVESGRTGLVVDPGSSDALADGLHNLLGNPVLAQRMGMAGRRRARERFSRVRMAAATAEVYQELIERPLRGPTRATEASISSSHCDTTRSSPKRDRTAV